MTKRLTIIACFLAICLGAAAQISLEECVTLATQNYPVIRKYDLISRTNDINISNINKTWLPQVNVYGQGSVQNAVPALPDILSAITSQNGMAADGLKKWQYKVGIDVNQTIWDGGTSAAQRHAEQALKDRQQSSLDVQMYAIRGRVEEIYFCALLTTEQIKQTQATINLLKSNLDRFRSMLAGGTAMQSDVDMIEAQCLTTAQQLVNNESRLREYKQLLSAFVGKDLTGTELIMPTQEKPSELSTARPEMEWYDADIRANEAFSRNIKAAIMPRVGLFTQAYYGYPGLNYFKSMMTRDLSFNIMAGVRVSWNISALYTKKNDLRKLTLASETTRTDRDEFLFNTRLQTISANNGIDEQESLIKDDGRIVELRCNIRKAAESQLRNGVIDAHGLLERITDENQACLTQVYHKIKLIQNIYKLKYTLNR